MALEPSDMHGPQDKEPNRDTVLLQLLLVLSFLTRFQSFISREEGFKDGILLTKLALLFGIGCLYTFWYFVEDSYLFKCIDVDNSKYLNYLNNSLYCFRDVGKLLYTFTT